MIIMPLRGAFAHVCQSDQRLPSTLLVPCTVELLARGTHPGSHPRSVQAHLLWATGRHSGPRACLLLLKLQKNCAHSMSMFTCSKDLI